MKHNHIPFTKFHGTGNDFIILDHTKEVFLDKENSLLIKAMCDRRFGIGADGLMIIEQGDNTVDFVMQYFNSDGNTSSMCGNGGRCITLAAKMLDIIDEQATFRFGQTIYHSEIAKNEIIGLKMQDLQEVRRDSNAYVLDTGSPHYVEFYTSVDEFDIKSQGAAIRYNETYNTNGINVNFCSWNNDLLQVRTYERGVEDETFSCGTGVVASAIAHCEQQNLEDGNHSIRIITKGGKLKVDLVKSSGSYSEIYLIGPAVCVFRGRYLLS